MFDLLSHPRFTNFNVLKQYQTEKKTAEKQQETKNIFVFFYTNFKRSFSIQIKLFF